MAGREGGRAAGCRRSASRSSRRSVEIEQAERQYDLNRAAELKYGKLPELEKKLAAAEAAGERDKDNKLVKEEVGEEDIAAVVSRWTGVPVSKLLEGEKQKLLHLEDELHKRVIGQDEAVHGGRRGGGPGPQRAEGPEPADRLVHLPRADRRRQDGAGPGAGRVPVRRRAGDGPHRHVASTRRSTPSRRLVGAPPGYVGYEEGGQLTEAVRRRPYCVILFDEIEKAHPDVFNVLLQVLDDGRLTDGQGRTVDFKNTIVIMTSNIGSQRILQYKGTHIGEVYDRMKDAVLDELRKHFRPEFLNRVDEIDRLPRPDARST